MEGAPAAAAPAADGTTAGGWRLAGDRLPTYAGPWSAETCEERRGGPRIDGDADRVHGERWALSPRSLADLISEPTSITSLHISAAAVKGVLRVALRLRQPARELNTMMSCKTCVVRGYTRSHRLARSTSH